MGETMTQLRVGVVGVGHLGKEHARILASLPEVDLVAVVDRDPAQAKAVASRCHTRAFTEHQPLLGHVDAVVIAVPTSHHHAVGQDFLARGIPLFIEKPLAPHPEEAEHLVALASRAGTVLQVGHIERFNPAFEELQQTPLRPRYISAERCGSFTGRSTDVGVVLDLMVHDLDLVRALNPAPVSRVEALGVAILGGHEDMAQARVTFADGCVADFRASRVHPQGVRCMHLWGAEGFAAVDFSRRHLTLQQPGRLLRQGGVDSRRLDPTLRANLRARLFEDFFEHWEADCTGGDQLTRELQAFLGCVRSGARPLADGEAGLKAVELAQQVLESLWHHPWEGTPEGPCGPCHLPTPRGPLVPMLPPSEAA
jgi:predicted dehydrogenase